MKTKQENRFTMHKAVQKFGQDNNTTLSANADVTMALGLLDDQIALVNGLIQTQNLDRSGVTVAKNIARDIVEERALSIAGRIKGWAYFHQNPVLEAEMNFTKGGKTASTGLHRLADTELAPVCRTILQRATDHLASITTITAPELTAFDGFILTYEGLVSAPATAEGQSVVATEQMEPTLDRTDEMLKEGLDRLMLAFTHTNPTLLATYKQARKIIDLGTRHEPDAPVPPTPPAPPTP
jgi:hypothetical protein